MIRQKEVKSWFTCRPLLIMAIALYARLPSRLLKLSIKLFQELPGTINPFEKSELNFDSSCFSL